MPAQTQVRRIEIKVNTNDAKGIKDIAQKLGYLNQNTKSLASGFGILTNAFRGWLGYLGVREVVGISDRIQLLNDRIEVLSGSVGRSREILGQLNEVSKDTKQSIETSAETYARLAAAVDTSIISQESLVSLTKVLQNSFRLAGATTTETTNTIIQLGQAFASGELRGQELRSVMEQNATLAKLLRERFGSDIYKKAATGAITLVDVLEVLRDNLEEINTKATQLSPTIEQTLTTNFNNLKLAILDLNKYLDLSGNFARFLEFAIDRIPALSAVLAVLALTRIPALITSLKALATALYVVTLSNPVTLALYGLAAAFVATTGSLDRLIQVGDFFLYWIARAMATLPDFVATTATLLGILRPDQTQGLRELSADIRDFAETIAEKYNTIAQAKESPADAIQKDRDAIQAAIEATRKTLKDKTKKIKDILGELNTAYKTGAIGIEEYNKRIVEFDLYKINREFKEGKYNLEDYNEKLKEINLKAFNRQLNLGAISVKEFNAKVLAENLRFLDIQVKNGTISLQEYNDEVNKLEKKYKDEGLFARGARGYVESLGETSDQIVSAVKNAFSGLEDALVSFTTTGEANFSKFTQAVLEDIQRIIIRAAIVKPLAQGILSGFDSTPTPGSSVSTNGYIGGSVGTNQFAKGGIFGVDKFASGGVFNSPTLFRYGKGRTGVMGEAGPEAILPLKKSSNGSLGVSASVAPVTVNVINQAGVEVATSEKNTPDGGKQIQILVTRAVNDGISSGTFDKSLRSSYGLRRKGV